VLPCAPSFGPVKLACLKNCGPVSLSTIFLVLKISKKRDFPGLPSIILSILTSASNKQKMFEDRGLPFVVTQQTILLQKGYSKVGIELMFT
jgi:hypothetical protein